MDDKKAAIGVHELSERLGISYPKAYELCHSGEIKIIKVGSRILIPLESLDDFLHGKK